MEVVLVEKGIWFGPHLETGFDLASNQLAVTPYKFAPDILCSCSPGWSLSRKDLDEDVWCFSKFSVQSCSDLKKFERKLFRSIMNHEMCWDVRSNMEQLRHGSGIQCEMCPANYFKNDTSPECIPCPEGSTAPNGSTAHENCKCEVGELFEKNGELKLDRRKGLTPVWCFFGDARFTVLETGQGALKENRNRHLSNVCNNSKRIAMKNSINQHKPNNFLDGTEFLHLPVVFTWLWDLHFGWGAVDAQLIKRIFKTVVYNARIYTWTVQHQVQPPSPLVHSRASPVWATRPGRLNVYPLKNGAMHQGRTIVHRQHWYLRAPKAMLVWCAWIVIPISMLLEGLARSVKIMIWNFQILGYSPPSSW